MKPSTKTSTKVMKATGTSNTSHGPVSCMRPFTMAQFAKWSNMVGDSITCR